MNSHDHEFQSCISWCMISNMNPHIWRTLWIKSGGTKVPHGFLHSTHWLPICWVHIFANFAYAFMITYFAYFRIFFAYKCTINAKETYLWLHCIFMHIFCIFLNISAYLNLHIMTYLPWCTFKHNAYIYIKHTYFCIFSKCILVHIWFCIFCTY